MSYLYQLEQQLYGKYGQAGIAQERRFDYLKSDDEDLGWGSAGHKPPLSTFLHTNMNIKRTCGDAVPLLLSSSS